MAISPEKPDHGIIATEKNKLNFAVLGDFGNELGRQFGIVFHVRQRRQEFSKNMLKDDIAPRNARLNRSFPRCAGIALPPCRPVRCPRLTDGEMLARRGLGSKRPRPILLASAAGSGGFAHLGSVVAIRDSRRPVRIRLLAENGLKRPPIVHLNVQAPLRSSISRELPVPCGMTRDSSGSSPGRADCASGPSQNLHRRPRYASPATLSA